jgi:hypothetical protein
MEDIQLSGGNLIKRDTDSFGVIDEESDPDHDDYAWQLSAIRSDSFPREMIGICGYGERVDYTYFSYNDIEKIIQELERLIERGS